MGTTDKAKLVKELRKTIKALAQEAPEATDKNGVDIDNTEDILAALEKKALKLLKQIVS